MSQLVSKGFWGSQRPKPPCLIPQTGEIPALTSVWMQQGCNWTIKEVGQRTLSCQNEKQKIPNKPRHVQKKILFFFFPNECRWGCSFLVLWAFTYKLLCNGSALLLVSVLLMSCTKGQGLSECCCGQCCDPLVLSLPHSPMATQGTRHPKKQSVTSAMPQESCPSSNEFSITFCEVLSVV